MLIDAVRRGDLAEIRRIIDTHPESLNERAPNGETPLMAALYRGQADAVALLLKSGAPLDIFSAAATGGLESLDREIARGAPAVTARAFDGWTPLHLAAFFGRYAAAERLIDAGAELSAVSANAMRNTPLHAALAGQHTEVALLLISRGADVRAVDAGGHTPLHIAAENGLIDAVRALLAAGADPHAVDAQENTPLSRAAARNRNEVVDLLNS
jgi:uncharacterized protein